MIQRYKFNNYTADVFFDSFKDNLVEKKEFDKGFYEYGIFNINNTTVILMKTGVSSEKNLTIGLDEKNIDGTIKLIKSRGFQLEEIIKE